jgi:hypothetical protein
MRRLIAVLLLAMSLFASHVKFKESRYIDATGKTINLKGEIEFAKDSIIVNYSEPSKKTLQVKGDMLTIQNENGTKETVDLNKNKHFGFYFSIFRSINEKNPDSFKEFFEVAKSQNGYKLTPKSELKKSIVQIAVKTTNDKPQNIKIELVNGDKIEINAEN